MERRILGQTGERLSVVGFGGIVVKDETPEATARFVARAIDRGVNYFDVGPSYGNAEERLGPALAPYRESVFPACKTLERTRDAAAAELRASLARLRTDHVDLYQIHGVLSLEDVDAVTAPGGALEAFVEARSQGRVRTIGFSAHNEEAALAFMDRFDFDSVLFPLNYLCWTKGNFGPRVFRRAQEKGMGILALKALAKTRWPEGGERRWPKCWYAPVDSPQEAALALRWTLSRPVTACVSPSHAELLWWACDAASKDTSPLSSAEERRLFQAAESVRPIFPA